MKYYYTPSVRKQNWLAENGILPVREEGKTAYYEKTNQLYSLLERYDIIQEVFKGRY